MLQGRGYAFLASPKSSDTSSSTLSGYSPLGSQAQPRLGDRSSGLWSQFSGKAEQWAQSLGALMIVSYTSSPVGPYDELIFIRSSEVVEGVIAMSSTEYAAFDAAGTADVDLHVDLGGSLCSGQQEGATAPDAGAFCPKPMPFSELRGTPVAKHNRTAPRISSIWVSTDVSTFNGRNNWGIPKFTADFKWGFDTTSGARTLSVSLPGATQPFFSSALLQVAPNIVPVSSKFIPECLRTLIHPRLDPLTNQSIPSE